MINIHSILLKLSKTYRDLYYENKRLAVELSGVETSYYELKKKV